MCGLPQTGIEPRPHALGVWSLSHWTTREVSPLNLKVTVLKDARTVIASPDGRVYVNTSGNCAMSTGGSGDVLTGIIGGFVCQGMDVFEAAVLGVFVHGRCGDYAAEKMGHYGVLAGNLIDALPYVIKNME